MAGFSTKTAQFAWKNLNIMILGRLITGITDVEYTPERNVEAIYGAGDKPQFLGEGNKSIPVIDYFPSQSFFSAKIFF